MFDKLCKKYLPVYFQFLPNYWLAIWSAPVRYRGQWKINNEWFFVSRNDTVWQSLRITIRKGQFHENSLIVLKRGTV